MSRQHLDSREGFDYHEFSAYCGQLEMMMEEQLREREAAEREAAAVADAATFNFNEDWEGYHELLSTV